MSSLLDISGRMTYPRPMFKSVTHVVHEIERFLDLLPEPMVLRALETPKQSSQNSSLAA